MDPDRISSILKQVREHRENENENENIEILETTVNVSEETPDLRKQSETTSTHSDQQPEKSTISQPLTTTISRQSQVPVSAPLPSKFKNPQLQRPSSLDQLLIHPSQVRGNPLFEELKKRPNIHYVISEDIMADYVPGYTCCVLFLSLKYHGLHPDYIETRMTKVGHSHDLQILLVLVDVDNSEGALKELTRMTVNKDFTMIVTSNVREAADYIYNFHRSQNRPPNILQKIPKSSYREQIIDVSSKVKNISSSNMFTIAAKYGSLKEAIAHANTDDIDELPGWGEKRAEAFRRAFDGNFYS